LTCRCTQCTSARTETSGPSCGDPAAAHVLACLPLSLEQSGQMCGSGRVPFSEGHGFPSFLVGWLVRSVRPAAGQPVLASKAAAASEPGLWAADCVRVGVQVLLLPVLGPPLFCDGKVLAGSWRGCAVLCIIMADWFLSMCVLSSHCGSVNEQLHSRTAAGGCACTQSQIQQIACLRLPEHCADETLKEV
jgi:hypothetical protein